MKKVCFTFSIVDREGHIVNFQGFEYLAELDMEDFKKIVKLLQSTHNFEEKTITTQMNYYSKIKCKMKKFGQEDGNASQAHMWYDVTEMAYSGTKNYMNTVVCNGKYETINYVMSDNEENYYINTSVGDDISKNKNLTVIDINEDYAEEDYNNLFDYAVNNFGDVNDQDLENFVGNQLEQIKSMDLGMQQGGDDLEV
jgi:hypothetical protein